MKESLKKNTLTSWPQLVFLLGSFAIIVINGTTLKPNLQKIIKLQQYTPFLFDGLQFNGLNKVFKDSTFVGYYTDKDMSSLENSKHFAQAQYVLSPVILELNNFNHEFTLFDCRTEQTAMKKIKELNLTAVKQNTSGIILAQRQ